MKKYLGWLLFLIAITLFTFSFDTFFKKFIHFNAYALNIVPADSLLFTSKSGREILPPEVQFALKTLDSLKAKDYSLAGTLPLSNGVFYQRIQESAWPIRYDTNSRIVIGYAEELAAKPEIKIVSRYDRFGLGIR